MPHIFHPLINTNPKKHEAQTEKASFLGLQDKSMFIRGTCSKQIRGGKENILLIKHNENLSIKLMICSESLNGYCDVCYLYYCLEKYFF